MNVRLVLLRVEVVTVTVIAIALVALGLVLVGVLALADPVLLSRFEESDFGTKEKRKAA